MYVFWWNESLSSCVGSLRQSSNPRTCAWSCTSRYAWELMRVDPTGTSRARCDLLLPCPKISTSSPMHTHWFIWRFIKNNYDIKASVYHRISHPKNLFFSLLGLWCDSALSPWKLIQMPPCATSYEKRRIGADSQRHVLFKILLALLHIF